MPASTLFRVPFNTKEQVNSSIRSRTEDSLDRYIFSPRREIDDRLRELAREWDVERTLEMNAALLSLAGLGLGIRISRKWLALPLVVASFLLQHALQGWCPPVTVLRRLGFRTATEINAERCALKLLRGDFRDISRRLPRADELLSAALD